MSGSNNFQQWNPPQNNQESDADYTSDVQRSLGATNPSIFPSATANKLFYQVSTFCAAFAAAFAAKGYAVADTVLATLQAVFAGIVTIADMTPIPVAFTLSPPAAFDCSLSVCPRFTMTLTGNLAGFTVPNPFSGQEVMFIFTQDGTGGRTVTWPASVVGGGNPDPTASSVSTQKFVYLADNKFHPITAMTS